MPHRPILMCADRRAEDAANLAERLQLEIGKRDFRSAATLTEIGASPLGWAAHTGSITVALVSNAIGELFRPVYWAVDPPKIVEAMHGFLTRTGVANGDLRSEEFSRY